MIKKFSTTLYWKYHQLRSVWLVWFYVLNHEGRRRWRHYKKASLRLTSVQERIVTDLNRDGIAIAHLDELFPGTFCSEILDAGRKTYEDGAAQEKIRMHEETKQTAKSDIIVHILGGYGDTRPSLSMRDPFLRFTLSGELLHVVSSYLEMFPLFKMCSLHSTILIPSGSRAMFSQRWHRDPDDKKLVKVFLYVSDVNDKGAGPFSYIKGSHLGGRWRNIYPQVPPVGSYPPEGSLEQIIPEDDRKMCLGRAGTLIFCDTSGFHKGGYSTTKRRLMYAATFTSQASALPANYTLTDREASQGLTEIARYAARL